VWRASLRGLVAHKLRLALTALAIVLGVAFVAGTLILTDTIDRSLSGVIDDAYAGVDVAVRGTQAFPGAQREPVPAGLLRTVERVPGVRAAHGNITGYAQFIGRDGKAIGGNGPPTLGLSWDPDPQLSSLTLREGRPPTGPDQVVIDAQTAKDHGFRVGQRVRIQFQGPSREFTISGIAGFGKTDSLAGASIAAFDNATAQRVLGSIGRYDTIDIAAAPGVSDTELTRRVAAVLPTGAEAISHSKLIHDQKNDIDKGLSIFRTALLVFAAISLFVGAFIILNTFSIIVAQRTRELALLRALGASPRQVTRLVRVEALAVGLLSSIIGLFAGIALAFGLVGLLSAFGAKLPDAGLRLTPQVVIVSLLVGTVVTLVASYGPSRRAARVPPVAALRDAALDESWSPWRRSVIGGLATVAGVAALLIGLFANVSQAAIWVGVGALLVFIGVAALSPLFARPLAGIIGWPLARLGLPSRLGRENAMRNPRRTSSTAAALMIGLGLVTFVTVFASSIKASLGASLADSVRADLVLSTDQVPFSPALAAKLRTLPQVGTVTEVRSGEFRFGDSNEQVQAINPAGAAATTDLGVSPGGLAALGRGGVLVSTTAAKDKHLAMGDTIPMRFAKTGVQRVPVVGTYSRGRFLWGDYLLSLKDYEANFTNQYDNPVRIAARPGVPVSRLQPAVKAAAAAFPSVKVQTPSEWKSDVEGNIDALLNLIYALLGLAIVIALLGIVNTLALSILERTREIGLLRAVGMGRRQVRAMIRSESVIVSVLGALLGVIVGIFFGWALTGSIDFLTELSIPVGTLILFLVLAAIAGVLAALGPARRASRMDVLQAIHSE
jgi:putative ABC transport system permease protein